MTVSGVSVSGAVPSTTYSFSWDSTNNVLNVTASPSGMSTSVNATLMPSASGQVMTVDAASLGVRLSVNVPTGASLNSALSGLNGQSVSTSPNPTTLGNQYSQFVAALGVDSNTAQGEVANQQVLIDHLQQQQQSVSGVSLDEETANLIQYQRSYQAAAHVMSVMDSLLDTLINHTGAGG